MQEKILRSLYGIESISSVKRPTDLPCLTTESVVYNTSQCNVCEWMNFLALTVEKRLTESGCRDNK
jgi:hypothetical protein